MTRIAIIGAGPTGLEAALAAAERGLDVTVYEAGARVAEHVRAWGHVRVFTPWSLNVSRRMAAALSGAGEAVPGAGTGERDVVPTGDELARRLYEPLSRVPALHGRVRLRTTVVAVGREGLLKHEEIASDRRAERPFRLLLASAGAERVEHADVVVDCSGSYGNPNALGDGGIPAPGERSVADRITRRLPDLAGNQADWANRTVLLTGSGHSAQTAARELAALARASDRTRVVWAIRDPAPTWGAVVDDPLPERARLHADAQALADGASPAIDVRRGWVTESLGAEGDRVRVTLRAPDGRAETLTVDRILALNGGVGDFTLYRQLQVHECYATSAPYNLAAALLGDAAGDCLDQSSHGVETLRSPEPNFFILGAKSYGRNSQFLFRIGWEQVDEVFGLLDERLGAARATA